jgi:hypothetical protein
LAGVTYGKEIQMKTNKLLGMFVFLSVLGFLLAGCASLDFEKEFSQITDAQISTFLKNESNRSQFPTKPAKLWMLESPAYWQKEYDLFQRNNNQLWKFFNTYNQYNQPRIDSLQERHLREQAEMFQYINNRTFSLKDIPTFSKDIFIFSNREQQTLIKAPVLTIPDFPKNPIIIRK